MLGGCGGRMAWQGSLTEDWPPPSKEEVKRARVELDTWDIVTIVAYFAIVMAVGLVVSSK